MFTLYTQIDDNNKQIRILLVFFSGYLIIITWFLFQLFSILIVLLLLIYLVSVIGALYLYSDKIILKISRAKIIDYSANQEFYHIVENLCITAGLPVPKIYIINDMAPNAFATGRDPQHASLVITKGLLQKLEKIELEGVIAHEISHIGNHDTLARTLVAAFTGFVAIASQKTGLTNSMDNKKADDIYKPDLEYVKAGNWDFVVAVIILMGAPIVPKIFQLMFFSKKEFLADADGALLTRYPEGLASALEKISADTEPLEAANKATAHLYIVNPLKGDGGRGWFSGLFSTHPPIEERIAALRGMDIGK